MLRSCDEICRTAPYTLAKFPACGGAGDGGGADSSDARVRRDEARHDGASANFPEKSPQEQRTVV
jgi:hypothetical protein